VNWAGDDVVQSEDWVRYLGELVGVEPEFVYLESGICSRPCDNTRRRSLIGDCEVDWRAGFRRLAETRHPDRVVA
jgi:hypothetical protein